MSFLAVRIAARTSRPSAFSTAGGCALAILSGSLALGCSSGPRAVLDAGPLDAPATDAPATDAPGLDALPFDAPRGLDAATTDAGVDARFDARAADAGALDSSPADTGPADARATDAGLPDAGTIDAGADAGATDAGPVGFVLECAMPVPPAASSGILLSSNFWSGFRFTIPGPADARATRLGVQLVPDTGAAAIFAALVRLTDASDTPDDPALGGADVITTTTIPVPATGGASVVASGTIDVTLSPGWYAVVFGTGAFGGTLSSGTIRSGGGGGCRSLSTGGFPFTLRQSDGMFILQGAEPHMFVQFAP